MGNLQIITVEHNDGYGMFNRNSNRRRISCFCPELVDRHKKFPPPARDGLNLYEGGFEWFCAFKSMEEFNSWVLPDEVKSLLEHNFRIYILEVTEFQIGQYQVIYRKESIVSKTDVSQLYL